MKNFRYTIVFVLFLSNHIFSQDLIQNASFEDKKWSASSTVPDDFSQVDKMEVWEDDKIIKHDFSTGQDFHLHSPDW